MRFPLIPILLLRTKYRGVVRRLCYNVVMLVQELIGDYTEHLEIEKGRSKKTVENYERYLLRFLELAGEITEKEFDLEPKDITREVLRKFRLKLNR